MAAVGVAVARRLTVPGGWALLALLACGRAPGPPGGPPPPAPPAGEVRVTLLQTTDLHHHAQDAGLDAGPAGETGGYARIAAYVEQVRARATQPVLLVDSGDWTMGTLYDLSLGRQPLALLFMEALRYDCVTLGNHEFDYGSAGLAGILGAARRDFGSRTPIVASNLEPDGLGELAPLAGPGRPIQGTRVAVLANGLRVGFLGLMGRDAAGDVLATARFRDYARDYRLVQDLVDDLRGPQGCGLVIALDHAGTDPGGASGEDVDLAANVAGIDVIASGHTHRPLARPLAVARGAWTTWICCAGAFGTHVERLDLVCHPGGGTSLEASEHRPMTDASLAALAPPAAADPAFGFLVGAADRALNRALAPVLTQLPGGADDLPDDPGRGLFRPLGHCDPTLRSNGLEPFPAPNGLGDLCADALRWVPNTLLAGSADPTPFTAGVLASGTLRGGLGGPGPITFSDVYGVLPLGTSPDPAQAEAGGEPLISVYLDPAGLRELCALQLLAQTGLVSSDWYLNLSGLSYRLEPAALPALFDAATGAAVLALAGRRAAAGSVAAAQALAGVASLPSDQGAALQLAGAAGNPFAQALGVLPGLGEVAAAVADAGRGGHRLETLLMARAKAAIGPVAAYLPGDPACTGTAVPLGPGRVRVAMDLYAILMLDRGRTRFGACAAAYQGPAGAARLSGAPEGRAALLDHRIALDPGGSFQELKAWMALLRYLAAPAGQGGHFEAGRITAEYASSPDFRQFPAAGAAVRRRNAAYPLDRIAALAATLAALEAVP